MTDNMNRVAELERTIVTQADRILRLELEKNELKKHCDILTDENKWEKNEREQLEKAIIALAKHIAIKS